MTGYLFTQRLCFAVIGIETQGQSKRGLRPTFRFVLWTSVTAITVLQMGLYISISEQDKAVKVLTVFLQGALSMLKSCMFMARSQRFCALIDNLEALAKITNEKERTLWHQENRLQRLIVRVYYMCCCATGTLYCAGPAIILLVTTLRGHSLRLLPFELYFPYYSQQLLYYALSYAWCASFLIYAIHSIVAMDGLFCWFIFNISAHFQILQGKFESYAEIISTKKFALFKKGMPQVFQYHQRIIDLTEEFAELFAPIVFTEVAVSYLKLCFSAYQLINLRELSMLPVITVGLITITIQLLIYCLSGQKIKDASGNLSQCIYLSYPWESISPQMRRLHLLPLMRTQRETKLTGYLFVVDHNLLVWIFRTTGTVIGFLSATKRKGESVICGN